MGSMKITKAGATAGAIVEGVDVRELDDSGFASVRQALLDHCVIAIRNQFMDPETHLAFARRFGRINMTAGTELALNKGIDTLTGDDKYPEIFRLRNMGKAAARTEHWHSDNPWSQQPTGISILAAQTIPPLGGDTLFCSQYNAYDRLSDAMKRMLRGVRLRHVGGRTLPAYRNRPIEEWPTATHPVVITHPVSRRRALYLGRAPGPDCNAFVGFTERETLPLQQFLYEHSFIPENVYRHRWQPGDVLLWDNLSSMHYAIHDYGDAARDMNRVTIESEVPADAPYDN